MNTSTIDEVRRSARARMIAEQLVRRGIADERVLAAMMLTPREEFMPVAKSEAYSDAPQGIGCGQTISQPYIVAVMLELARIQPTHRVLEVGTGTGYQAALLSRLARSVVTVERHAPLAQQARENFGRLGIENVEVRVGDGTLGAPDRAPFDAIIVAAAGPDVPPALVEQIAPGGCLVGPFGNPSSQRLVRVSRDPVTGEVRQTEHEPVVFVPLIGSQGWRET